MESVTLNPATLTPASIHAQSQSISVAGLASREPIVPEAGSTYDLPMDSEAVEGVCGLFRPREIVGGPAK